LPHSFQGFVGQSCLQLGRTGGRGLPPRALGAKFVTASPVLQDFANCVCLTAQVRGSCRCARVRSRRVGLGQTKRNSPQAQFCPRLRFAGILCDSESVAPRKRYSTWSVCRNLHSYAGVSRCRTRVVSELSCRRLRCAVGLWSRAGVAVVSPSHAQVRGPSGRARVLPRGNGIVHVVVGAWEKFLSGPLGAAASPRSPYGVTVVAPCYAPV